MSTHMERLAGVKKRVKVAPLEQLLFNAMEAAAMLRISETVFRRLVQAGHIRPKVIPGGRGEKPMRRYSRRDLESLIAELPDVCGCPNCKPQTKSPAEHEADQ